MIHYRGNKRARQHYQTIGHQGSRWLPIIIIVAVLLGAFLIMRFTGVGGINETSFINQRNAKLRNEMQHAVSTTNKLSRLGASSTTIELARIRQYVHGIEVINDLNVSVYGEIGRLFPQSTFDNIYAILDAYDAKLASGQKVNDSLNSLTEAINELNRLTGEVLGHDVDPDAD
ncbi:MAG: hypothetical protein E7319_00175 [Clostridiales bacterium]|nr:hypothetical protein [Clostridiales bacterium]